jgi:hypothetical protein
MAETKLHGFLARTSNCCLWTIIMVELMIFLMLIIYWLFIANYAKSIIEAVSGQGISWILRVYINWVLETANLRRQSNVDGNSLCLNWPCNESLAFGSKNVQSHKYHSYLPSLKPGDTVHAFCVSKTVGKAEYYFGTSGLVSHFYYNPETNTPWL